MCSIRHKREANLSMTDPKDRVMLKKFIIADAAACLFMHFKEFGILGENTCTSQESPISAEAANIEKLMYTKAIAFMASKALERPIKAAMAENMYKVLIQEGHESDIFKRVHGKAFPRDFTDDGWRSSFKALINHVDGIVD